MDKKFLLIMLLLFSLETFAIEKQESPSFIFASKENIVSFSCDGKTLAGINAKAPWLLIEEQGKSPVSVTGFKVSENTPGKSLVLESKKIPGLDIIQKFQTKQIENNRVISSEIKIKAKRKACFILTQPFSISPQQKPVFLSPGYIYNTNNAKRSQGKFPQLAYKGKTQIPESPAFYFRADRSSHCSVMAMFDGFLAAICIPEGVRSGARFYYNGLGIDTSNKGCDLLCVSLGYKNFPARYNGNCNPRISARWNEKPDYGFIRLEPGEEISAQFLIYTDRAADNFAFEKPLKTFYYFLATPTKAKTDPETAASLISRAIIQDTLVKECNLFRVTDKGNECDIGWTGGMMVACPLILAGKKYNDKQVYNTGVNAMDSLIKNGFNEKANMFYDSFREGKWTVDGWWKSWAGGFHLSYTNGQSVYFLLKAYTELSPGEKKSRDLWLARCRKIIDHAIKNQKPSGEFPASFSPDDGSPGEIQGFGGCWMLPASLMAYKIFHDEKYLKAAIKAEKFYFEWLSTLEVWGTPIDAEGAVELEGNLPLVIAERLLCEITGTDRSLNNLVHAINYDLSWKWAYNTHLENPPLKELDWKSIGGNVASTCNIHLHPMSNMILDELWYVYEKTGDPYYKSRYEDSFKFGLECINLKEGEFGFGKPGWGTEQFFHTDAIQGQGPPDGGIWVRFLPWATAAILHGIVTAPESVLTQLAPSKQE